MVAAYSSLGGTKVLYATSLVLRGAKAKFLRRKPSVLNSVQKLCGTGFSQFPLLNIVLGPILL